MSTVVTVLLALALLAVLGRLWQRGVRVRDGDRGWQLMLAGVGALAVSALIAIGLDAVGPDDGPHRYSLGNLAFSVGCILVCGLLYQGLIEWNRARTGARDPGEQLNGFCAVLVLVGIADLILPHVRDTPAGLARWELEASFWACGSIIVVFGTAASIAGLGLLLRDARIWLVITGLTGFVGAQAVSLLAGDLSHPYTRVAWLLSAALIPAAVAFPSTLSRPRALDSQATILGSLVVLLCGVAVLTVDNTLVADDSLVPTGYALAGVVGVSFRVLRLVRDLANLAQTRHEAMTDELTGVANRRALLGAIDDALRTAGSTSLLIIDLDRFKAINDRYGHAAGDLLLRHTTAAFAAQVPPGGLLARLGGDEFAVLLIDVPPAAATAVARNLAQAAAPLSDVKGRLLQVGASVGVATVGVAPGGVATVGISTVDVAGLGGGELLRRADAAMYRAKTSGSGVEVYDPALDAVAQQRLGLVEDLHRALEGPETEREQIVVHFQPQLDLADGAVVGAEALVRWQHPRLGLLAPDEFIDLAEQNELMPSLTRRVMLEAAAQARTWRRDGHRLRVSVNLSAGGLGHRDLLPLIEEVLAGGLAPHDLVLEVTETSLMNEPEQALRALNRIAESGVGISIDDYGTGYSSLSYLNDLPATELKIDRSFTARAATDPRTAAIVGATVDLAHRLGLRLIAEGIEDDATLAVMRRIGCDESQGYLHCRPLPAEVFRQWLQARTLEAGTTPVSSSAR